MYFFPLKMPCNYFSKQRWWSHYPVPLYYIFTKQYIVFSINELPAGPCKQMICVMLPNIFPQIVPCNSQISVSYIAKLGDFSILVLVTNGKGIAVRTVNYWIKHQDARMLFCCSSLTCSIDHPLYVVGEKFSGGKSHWFPVWFPLVPMYRTMSCWILDTDLISKDTVFTW